MKPITQSVTSFEPMHAWANRILRVDLDNMCISVQPSAPYLPDLIGARGIAARICWDDYPVPVGAFDPANPLMVFGGALTGTRAPYSGRTTVCGFSPQGYPHPWFTRSSVGGHFGGELKRAGYDGLVVTGAAEAPVHIRIRDDEISILPADRGSGEDLWGLDTVQTLESLVQAEGEGTRSLVIGPAGENLSRIATIHTALASASGSGGFGAVMGAKRLKAISVRAGKHRGQQDAGHVSLARPETVRSIARALARIYAQDGLSGPLNFYGDIEQYNRELAAAGDGRARRHGCTEGCITPCAAYMQDVPGHVCDRKWSGGWVCVGTRFEGFAPDDPSPLRAVFDWQLPRRAAFELSVLSNRYGLNQIDLIEGMVPWLIACQRAGLLSDINGRAIDWSSPGFWAAFLQDIAHREGMGDALAEGGRRAARLLCLGEHLVRDRYPGWGYSSHCDGREGGRIVFPYWVVSALQWLCDTRDPFGSGHGYLWAAGAVDRAAGLDTPREQEALLDQIRAIGVHVYGSIDAVDPRSGYRDKAYPAYYQTLRAVIKDCLPADAHFPLLYRRKSPDGYWRLGGIAGAGEIEGPSIEYHLFVAGTGTQWSEGEFEHAAERVCTLERALQVRHWGRDRAMDESVLPYFEELELHQNAYLSKRHRLDRQQFRPVQDEFYQLHGWDTRRGWPTEERLCDLKLGDLYQEMVAGAMRATAGQ
jgi:aldehyde:ferredoxin oxidoreductase